jgi:hypothetical protein
MKMSKKNTFETTETIGTDVIGTDVIGTDAPNDPNGENVSGAPGASVHAEQAPAAEHTVPADTAAAAPGRAEPVIYCGPNIPKGNLLSMAVFRGGMPGNIQRMIEKIPEIGGLIVPVSRLADTRKKIAAHGSEENRLNQVILAAREGI